MSRRAARLWSPQQILTLTGGLTTGIGAALSVVSLTKREDKQMARDMAKAFDDALKQHGLRDDRKRIAIQMFARYPPSELDNAKGNMIPAQIAR